MGMYVGQTCSLPVQYGASAPQHGRLLLAASWAAADMLDSQAYLSSNIGELHHTLGALQPPLAFGVNSPECVLWQLVRIGFHPVKPVMVVGL